MQESSTFHKSDGLKSLLKKMNRRSFDLSPDGVLIFRDPMIGRLENRRKALAVRCHQNEPLLQLWHRGCVIAAFDLAAGIQSACNEAFHAYFRAFAGS